jgi:hypothetical protein
MPSPPVLPFLIRGGLLEKCISGGAGQFAPKGEVSERIKNLIRIFCLLIELIG